MATLRRALEMAAQDLQADRLDAAEAICRQMLEQLPAQPEALHLLGVIHLQAHRHDQAAGAIEKAIAATDRDSRQPAMHLNLGIIYKSQDRRDEAIEQYEQALQLDPQFVEALTNLGNVLYEQDLLDRSIDASSRAIALEPGMAPAHNNLANALKAKGQLDQAIEHYQTALSIKPRDPQVSGNLAGALIMAGKVDDGLAKAQQAVKLDRDCPIAHQHLANALKMLGRLDDALVAFERALELSPDDAVVHNDYAGALLLAGRIEQSEQAARRALQLDPDYARAHLSLGLALTQDGAYDEARTHYEAAERSEGRPGDATMNLGVLYNRQGDAQRAIECYRRLLQVEPDNPVVNDNLLFTHHYLTDADPQAVFELHAQWGQRVVEQVGPAAAHGNDASADRPLRIGYVSPDFRTHAVTFFIAPILTHHDKRTVETYCYAQVYLPDAATQQLQSLAGHWRSTCGQSDEKVAQMIRRDRIDILVDLAGHTARNRLGVFARKPAPIQVTYLGYPNTTGLATIDYRLTDHAADPPGVHTPHTEQLVHLEHGISCYAPRTDAPPVNASPAQQNGYVTFGSLSNPAKINRFVIELWSRLLHAAPSSRLLLIRDSFRGSVREALSNAFAAHGIEPSRLTIDTDTPTSQRSSGYHLMDIALDPYPYAGHTTTCDALWMGVPVVTLAGPTMVTRMSASVMTQVGLEQWIAHDADQYITIADQLAADFEGLARWRRLLRQKCIASPLCRAEPFTKHLEQRYRWMWQQWCAQQRIAA